MIKTGQVLRSCFGVVTFLPFEPRAFKILLLLWFAYPGAIELSILSKHYQTEIAVVDIESERVDRFGKTQLFLSLYHTLTICFPKKYPVLSPYPFPPPVWKFCFRNSKKVHLSTFLWNFKLWKHLIKLWLF